MLGMFKEEIMSENIKNYDLSSFKGTKREFIRMLADASALSQKDASAITDTFLYILEVYLTNTPAKRDNFIGWGSFQIATRKARNYRHPSDKSRVVSAPARSVVRFRPGKRLRDLIAKL